jgi:hypothetical protein
MNEWIMDSTGCRHAFRQALLSQVTDPNSHRMHLARSTWSPDEPPSLEPCLRSALTRQQTKPRQLDLFANQDDAPSDGDLVCQLQVLRQQGLLFLADDEAWDMKTVVATEAAWRGAGLIAAPTSETVAVAVTAAQLDVPIVTNDSDLTKLAHHVRLQVMSVSRLAAKLAAHSASTANGARRKLLART